MSTQYLNLNNLLPTQGIKITGVAGGSYASNEPAGRLVSGAGDVNGDGYDDIIIGSPGNTAAYLIYGNKTFMASTISISDVATSYGVYINGVSAGNQFGYSVSGAGDVNKDGYDDVMVGINGNGNNNICSYVIFGNMSLPSTIYISSISGFGIQGTYGCQASQNSGLGDINKDGYDDVISNNIIVFGNSSFPSTISSSTMDSRGVTLLYDGSSSGAAFDSVGGAGDINKDGYNDIIVGNGLGVVNIIYGNTTFPPSISLSKTSGKADVFITVASSYSASALGVSVRGAGDVNRDGYLDVIMGDSNKNIAYVLYGSKSLPSYITTSNIHSYGFNVTGTSGSVGWSVSGAGDINKDGYHDIIIGAPNYASGELGESYVVYGNNSLPALVNLNDLQNHGFTLTESSSSGKHIGYAVSGAGDVNGDGYDDFLVDQLYTSTNSGVSNLYLLYGAESGFATSAPSANPTTGPSYYPSGQPSSYPSGQPSVQPTLQPSDQPSVQPSAQPSMKPTSQPSSYPSGQPSVQPTLQPSDQPSIQPSAQPSMKPTSQPSSYPSEKPTSAPSAQPTYEDVGGNSKIDIAAIAGGVIGGAVVVIGVGYCIYAKLQHVFPFSLENAKDMVHNLELNTVASAVTNNPIIGEVGLAAESV
ncbi:MAG: FG-GAP-like repeat-containing protein [Rickettsiales bacterium]